MTTKSTYQSIINQLDAIPQDQLYIVESFLRRQSVELDDVVPNKVETLKLAGSWVDMSDKQFEEYLASTQKIRSEMFDRNVEL